MASTVETLATEIAALDEDNQEVIWERVLELNYRRGLKGLSERYRQRLQKQGELDRSAGEILARLGEIREEIAAHDYSS